jgi:hypothetical protein
MGGEGRRQETGDRRQKTGDRRQETEDRRQKTGDRRQNAVWRRIPGVPGYALRFACASTLTLILITSSTWIRIFDILLDVYYTSCKVGCQVNFNHRFHRFSQIQRIWATKAQRHGGQATGKHSGAGGASFRS